MRKLLGLLLLLGSGLCFPQTALGAADKLDLSGIWRFQLDPLGFGKTPGSELYLDKLAETIVLPGSTDEAGKGVKNNARYVDRLSRKFEYQGPAWYQREVVIPESWKEKHMVLQLERCHWETTVYVDGELAGTDERLSTPNRFDVSRFLTPGVHTLTICVDNRLKYPMDHWNHGTTEYTQTNWNGIVGDISLVATETVRIGRANVYPDVEGRCIRTRIEIEGLRQGQQARLQLTVREKGGRQVRADALLSFPYPISSKSNYLCTL